MVCLVLLSGMVKYIHYVIPSLIISSTVSIRIGDDHKMIKVIFYDNHHEVPRDFLFLD